MSLWLPVLLALFISVLGGLHLLGVFRRRRPKEPPLDKGHIPWLGHALDFKNNKVEFLQKMQRKHGDIFTVQIGGNCITFVMDPFSFGSILNVTRSKMDMNPIVKQLVARAFGYHHLENEHKVMEATNKHLMGDGLVVLTQTMMKNLQNLMLHSIGTVKNQKEWQYDGLLHYSSNTVFQAGYLSLFGNETVKSMGSKEKAEEFDWVHSEELFNEFRKYDSLFPNLVYAMLSLKDKLEAERLKRLFWNVLSFKKIMQKDNVSRWIIDHLQLRQEQGMAEYMQARFMFVLLWGSQSNTGPASFWLLFFLMKHPEAFKAVKEEVEKVLKETNQEVKPGGPLINLTRDMLMKTPILDSTVEETLRLMSAPGLIRAIMQDMDFKMADGREYALRKGDRIGIFPYISVHMDLEIHPEPHQFKYDRFLSPDGIRRTSFYKNGKKVKYFTMPWGGGISMCPGRFLATNELKQFVFLMLVYFDIELVNAEEENPPIDQNRVGFGIVHPTRDIQFRYKLRF
ncbi:5-beta-cholestane-3-alpha,7-alpha-diol 12-alpha-hydroxylase-like [Microcaecilia unicolor]|uniref:5-beta-cholestane-3-alpha,7-alpha-diol 12-alpha-hydroxylase-like n=1 Tax=Microcaecilia unicolor TaxID=1415580 RepID=A0A6P7XRP7_9AMPH|nr:5-beta-cholestane-3-alpha,7-alpha-diol 12-alpha-hydroxylase-like [Microcaecilia unicolor]XP_030053324.1 5-beta-cholestane-3-alpha,7-alpha-diol 12-alpha-hydroxylase-like [Microcaecilia unicolor]XP_030053330.1 5-beta-cholestane-3-alpha,7-alpha-diol 12-alpha-hydroxylase-like [Microcaecilia unicolor]XP_030053340.1 5-beta-cholestane-3-alpha,7-alpha-diol 12-alpha-hydroxylase-like [Microcaecilia unicolor]